MMSAPEFPPLPRSPSFYYFRSNSAISPPRSSSPSSPSRRKLLVDDGLPHFMGRMMCSVAAVVLPVVLLPFHFFLFVLSVSTTLAALVFLSLRAFAVYVGIAVRAASQMCSDYVLQERKGRKKRDFLRRLVLE